ncbi:MAG: hypothetical protein ACLSE4_16350 [Clostridium sp.]
MEQAGKLSEAYAHYRKAADGNDDSAWWALGRFYENGVVVAQDGKEARRCYETGEKLGSVKCKNALGALQAFGYRRPQGKESRFGSMPSGVGIGKGEQRKRELRL